ncbi:MAG TPA: hypothetical protein DCO90_19150 [Sphingobacterium sp.]|nr:hypothetical protein [Sphingobacterium sp.]
MKRKKTSNFSRIIFITLIIASGFYVQSCSKSVSTNAADVDAAEVSVNISVGEPDEERVVVASTKRESVSSEEQVSEVSLADNLTMGVTLTRTEETSAGTAIQSAAVNTNNQLKATATITNKTLHNGVKYRIVVYDAAGNYVQTNDFTYGSASARFSLNAGQDYTFVGYSTNSTSAVPAVSNISKLSTAQLKDISGTLMFFKKSLKLVYGNNNLDLVLQHQFSQITTTVKMDDAMTGAITTLTGMSISPSKSTASLNFSDGSLTYATANTSTGIVFPALTGGLRSITSSPTLLISPNTSTAALTIGSITLDGETKSNIPVPNIKIVPGYRYNLVLNFKTCTQNVTSDVLNWNYERTSWTVGRTTYYGITKDGVNYKNNEVITNTFNAPMANYGFQFDITEFDNAFNMQVNGQYIFGSITNDQVQFQTNTSLGTVRNIEFVDGTEYSTNGIPEVFDMKGTAAAPLLRIVISRNGEVSLLGSKTNGGELVALRLKAGTKFNTVNWNTTGNNTVIISQKVDGKTVIIGTGNGRKMISCKTN